MAEKSEKSLKKWTDEEIEKLIDLYEENPCLWDIFDKSYQKRDVKERATAYIAEDLNRDVTDIKAKWNAIRGQFGRELNKALASKSGQSTAELYVSQWTFWERLQYCVDNCKFFFLPLSCVVDRVSSYNFLKRKRHHLQ